MKLDSAFSVDVKVNKENRKEVPNYSGESLGNRIDSDKRLNPIIQLEKNTYSKELQKEIEQPPKQSELLRSQGLYEEKVADNKALKNPIIETPEFLNKKSEVLVKGELKSCTNWELMKMGRAPIGPDGKSMELHHCNQKQDSTLAELSSTFHRENYMDLHKNVGQSRSEIDRKAFHSQKMSYWKARAQEIEKKGIV